MKYLTLIPTVLDHKYRERFNEETTTYFKRQTANQQRKKELSVVKY